MCLQSVRIGACQFAYISSVAPRMLEHGPYRPPILNSVSAVTMPSARSTEPTMA